jgi:hypothetical protein
MPSSTFKETIRLKLEQKVRKDFSQGKVAPALAAKLDKIADDHAKAKLTVYAGVVNGVLAEAIDGFSDKLTNGVRGLSPAFNANYVKYQKSKYPSYTSKFWRLSGRTAVAFKIEKNQYLTQVRAAKPSFKLLKSTRIPNGKQYAFRLSSNVPKWQILGLEQMMIDPMSGVKVARTEALPYGLRTLVFNEEGVVGRGSRGYHPARPIMSKYFQVWKAKLDRRLGSYLG